MATYTVCSTGNRKKPKKNKELRESQATRVTTNKQGDPTRFINMSHVQPSIH